MSAIPRFVPMAGDSMEPTLRTGDLVAVLPGATWRGDGLYVLCEADTPLIVRASSDFRGGVTVAYDNKRYSSWTLTRGQFTASMLGVVFAICRIVDRAVMEDAGVLASWAPQIDGAA